jgi:membrane-bound inhibitor of C-type lysozyme
MPKILTRCHQIPSAARKSFAIGTLTALATAACQNSQILTPLGRDAMDKERATEQTFVFECSDGFRFTARTAENTLWLFLPKQAIQVPRVRSGSGTKYASDKISFWNRGEVALLETETGSHQNCVNNATQAVWEHAKLEGVDFRATGNDPGWYMEITLGDEIVLVTDYGKSAYRFKTPEPDIDPTARKTTYRTEDGQRRLVVELEGKRCQDSIIDHSFEVTVRVKLDERQLHGCGKALH